MTPLTAIAATLPPDALEAVVSRLGPLFLSNFGGDAIAARDYAARLLDGFHLLTDEEFFLAGSFIAFSIQALEALAQAANTDLPVNQILRLRGGAVSLSREAEKARHQLAQIRKGRQKVQTAALASEIDTAPVCPAAPQGFAQLRPAAPMDLPPMDLPTAGSAANARNPQVSVDEADEHHQRDLRIAAGLKRMEARIAAAAFANGMFPPAALAAPPAQNTHTPAAPPAATPARAD